MESLGYCLEKDDVFERIVELIVGIFKLMIATFEFFNDFVL